MLRPAPTHILLFQSGRQFLRTIQALDAPLDFILQTFLLLVGFVSALRAGVAPSQRILVFRSS